MGAGDEFTKAAVKSPFLSIMKHRTARVKLDNIWSVIYLEQISPTIWNLGIIVNKSRRATNDWYFGRRNKRSRRVSTQSPVGSLKHLRAALTLLKRLLKELPTGHHVYTQPESDRSALLSKYIQRLGFIPYLADGKYFWVLTADRREEVLRYSECTNELSN